MKGSLKAEVRPACPLCERWSAHCGLFSELDCLGRVNLFECSEVIVECSLFGESQEAKRTTATCVEPLTDSRS